MLIIFSFYDSLDKVCFCFFSLCRVMLETQVQGALTFFLMPSAITELKCSLAKQISGCSFAFILILLDITFYFAAVVVIYFLHVFSCYLL